MCDYIKYFLLRMRKNELLSEDHREFLNRQKKKTSLVLSRKTSIMIVIIPGNLTLGRNEL
jgi:hypothetical protein